MPKSTIYYQLKKPLSQFGISLIDASRTSEIATSVAKPEVTTSFEKQLYFPKPSTSAPSIRKKKKCSVPYPLKINHIFLTEIIC